ncbi:MAG: septum formation initiator family protein [Erysipelotrichaceae bacterium]|nr:septum formation initiator family protein [Erysipelotrichaceae bacterium]
MSQKKTRKTLNRKLRTKLFSIVLILAAIVLSINVSKQVYRLYSLKKQSRIVEEELIKLQDENAALLTTKNKLEDPNYVTTYARGEYMFSKGDEQVFYLPSDSSVSEETSQ